MRIATSPAVPTPVNSFKWSGWVSAGLIGACVLLGAPASAKDAALAKAIEGSHRTPAFVERDKVRHPQQVLEFFGIKPNMTVLEINPGGGYWTEILAPYLKDKGTYYTTVSPKAMGERAVKAAADWQAKLDAKKDVYGSPKLAEFGAASPKSCRRVRWRGC
jgi:predicted methyltransferase